MEREEGLDQACCMLLAVAYMEQFFGDFGIGFFFSGDFRNGSSWVK